MCLPCYHPTLSPSHHPQPPALDVIPASVTDTGGMRCEWCNRKSISAMTWHCGFLCLRNTESLETLAKELITGDFLSFLFNSSQLVIVKEKGKKARQSTLRACWWMRFCFAIHSIEIILVSSWLGCVLFLSLSLLGFVSTYKNIHHVLRYNPDAIPHAVHGRSSLWPASCCPA